MGKKIVYKLFTFMLVMNLNSYSQDLLSKKLKWLNVDSIDNKIFNDSVEVNKWCIEQLPFSDLISQEIIFGQDKFLINQVIGCSGIPCKNIYIFKKSYNYWEIINYAKIRLKTDILIEIDEKLKKLHLNLKMM
jgi:hypothetical protein